ncbi:MAG: PEGA domain-containing protein, partial [Myxococcales bacterium]|nr:PEGA domain-containing protein [Myxococcales bacterium]
VDALGGDLAKDMERLRNRFLGLRLDGDAGVAIVDAGAPVIVVIDAGPPAPVELAVTIESRPTLELTIDGNVVGKTPWTGPLPMGAHKLKLENKDLLISAGRTVTVQGSEPITQAYTFEKGTVGVNAPPGAVIFIDTKKQGVAPLANDLSIYEGYHRILVKVGQAQWTETFSLFAGQRVSFNVELE